MRSLGRCRTRRDDDGRRGGRKRGLSATLAAEFTTEIATLIGPAAGADIDFEAVEIAARRAALRLVARAVEQRLNADVTDHAGPTAPCACGRDAVYAGRRPKTFTTVLGPMRLDRAYYSCATCHQGVAPRDCALGLVDTSLSPAVTRMIGRTAALVSFAESRDLLQELAGLAVDAKQVERTAEALGRAIAADEQHIVTPGAPDEPVAPTLYLGMDGTGVPMRATAVQGRAGKQPDGTANTREVKLVTVWSAEGRAADGTPVRDAGSVTYSAAIESAAQKDTDDGPSPFAARVEREATRRGFDWAARRAVLGDGATWIWNLADEYFPDAVQIVDRFHAKQHLSDVGKAIYGATSDLARTWAHARHDELDAGQLDAVLTALRAHPHDDAARRCADYVERNRHRMQYPACRAAGLCTSTGVVEAGCKVAIGTRLKRTGMHWTVAGADAIIALRCCLLSGRYEDFWERRSAARAA